MSALSTISGEGVFRYLEGGGDRWSAGVLEVSAFPIPAEEERIVRPISNAILDRLLATHAGAVAEVFFQFHALAPGEDIARLQRYGRSWMPELGLGIWPDRDPPKLWTKEEFEEMDFHNVRPLMYKAFRIGGDAAARRHAWDIMLGRGHLLFIAVTDSNAFFDAVARAFLPRIEEPALKSFPFYVPFVDANGLVSRNDGKLEASLPHVLFYLRESVEDRGVLVLSRQPLAPVLEGLPVRRERTR